MAQLTGKETIFNNSKLLELKFISKNNSYDFISLFLRLEHTVKYFLQNISWNTYFTIVSKCYREMFMIYFLKHFMKYENSENRFSESSSLWKTFLLNLLSCLINSFVIKDVCKNLKENVKIKVKIKHKVVFRTLYWKNWKIDSSSFFRIMNEKDFDFDAVTRFQAY